MMDDLPEKESKLIHRLAGNLFRDFRNPLPSATHLKLLSLYGTLLAFYLHNRLDLFSNGFSRSWLKIPGACNLACRGVSFFERSREIPYPDSSKVIQFSRSHFLS